MKHEKKNLLYVLQYVAKLLLLQNRPSSLKNKAKSIKRIRKMYIKKVKRK